MKYEVYTNNICHLNSYLEENRCISITKTNMSVLFTNVLCAQSERRDTEIIQFYVHTLHLD